MENTIEQQVLSMIAANPGITVRQIHALRPAATLGLQSAT